MTELTEELKVLVTAEVDRAVRDLQKVDKQTELSSKLFKNLEKSIASAFSATQIISFLKDSVEAYSVQQQAVAVLNNTLVSTGAAAWTTGEELQKMASSLQNVTNYGDETILSMQSVLLGFRNIQGVNFNRATESILDMATVMGGDLTSAAQAVGKALDDPINGLDSLRRQGFYFTAAQKNMIQALIDAGDAAGAQKLILDELDKAYGGSAKAAAQFLEQLTNAWGDLKEGVGAFFSGIPGADAIGKGAIKALQFYADGFSNFWGYLAEDVALVKSALGDDGAYQEWFNSLDLAKQYETALKNMEVARQNLNKATEEGNSKEISEAAEILNRWQNVVKTKSQELKVQQEELKAQQEQKKALSDAYELMDAINSEYDKLSANDPSVQLVKYREQLEKIATDRVSLSNIDPTLEIDVTDALSQLDYMEKTIRQKIADLQKDGKKSWQDWWEDVTGISKSQFASGREAGAAYVKGLEEALSDAQTLSSALGEEFDLAEYLGAQEDEVKNVLETLLSIPADQIDEQYRLIDGSIDELIQKYAQLKAARESAEKSDSIIELLNELEERVNSLGMSERELALARLEAAGATEAEIREAEKLFDLLAQQEQAVGDWESFLENSFDGLLEKWHVTSDELRKSISKLGADLTNMGINAALSGFEKFGEALGEGKDSADAMHSALASMAQEILQQLPVLFLQAGLQLVATPGMWPIGLGFIAAAGSTALVNGFAKGYTDSLSQNADGGVFGDETYSAFAKGGTFTNAIVSSPTFFRFAKGGGFGAGVMGEAGPEAVMPLTRGADGSLGVHAAGFGERDYSLTVVINNYGNEKVSAKESTDEKSGQRKLEIQIGTMINAHLSSGKADKAMKSRYGVSVQGV